MNRDAVSILFIDRILSRSDGLFSGIELNPNITSWEHQFPAITRVLLQHPREVRVDFDNVGNSIALCTGAKGTWVEADGMPVPDGSNADLLKRAIENRLDVKLEPLLSMEELPALLNASLQSVGISVKCIISLSVERLQDLPHFQNVIARARYEREELYRDTENDLGVSLSYSANEGMMKGLKKLSEIAANSTFTLPVAIRSGEEFVLAAAVLRLEFARGECEAMIYPSDGAAKVRVGTELLLVRQPHRGAEIVTDKIGTVVKIGNM